MWNSTRGRISLSAFLYLAMVCFISPKEPAETPSQQHLQQPSRPLEEAMSPADSGGRRLYVRDRSGGGGGAGNNPCVTTTLSSPSTPGPRGWNAFRGSSEAAEAREGGTPSPASVSNFAQSLAARGGFHAAAARTRRLKRNKLQLSQSEEP